MTQITIVSVGPTEEKVGKTGKTYAQVEVFYKDDQGRAKSKKIMNFARDVFPTVAKASPGEVYEVKLEKKGDFWEWIAINKVEGGAAAPQGAGAAAPRTFGGRKSDEEVERIARSVALKAAVDYLATCASGKADKSPQAVLSVAVQFELYLAKGFEGVTEAAFALPKKAATIPDIPDSDDIDLE